MDATFSQDLFGVEFDPLYSEIEATLAQQDESSDPLSTSHEPPKINWQLIAEQCEKLLEQCYDLRVMLWLIRANMHLEGVSALFRGLAKLTDRIAENPDSIYPLSEDIPVNSGHATALGWLSTAQCIAELKSSRLTVEHLFTVQELISSESNANELLRYPLISSTQLLSVNAYFQKNNHPDLLEQFNSISKKIKIIEEYANQYSDSYQLICDQLHIFLAKCITFLTQTNNHKNNNDISLGEDILTSAPTKETFPPVENIHIRSRQEIIIMLDRILEYFQHFEPSHPAPIFIRRSKQMIGMDFVSIVEDLLPESLIALQQFTGK
ncbi:MULTISPECIES: ImpA family type VI secretion system protein [unclassified Serratia (in: enterobacteria)]|uniref:type VI secretion system protein TssA n=1 Tax=unclassified Serratia (in: enterobacteria) TaxID=2647522 RepID=UPI0005005FE8|nr:MULTISPECIES: type VI secretion system ImpA family N-terminal domain-containing protein [unclassified Serratia (in: enterobacteria)]KFK95543.1 membrane protein [Serratia sp. Ag2]KFL00443.1 membrane protein [Serratia sp. Ag1]